MLRPRFLPRFSVVITDFYPHLIAVPTPKSSHTLQLIFNTIFQVARHNQVLVPRPVPSPCPLPSRGPPSRASPSITARLAACSWLWCWSSLPPHFHIWTHSPGGFPRKGAPGKETGAACASTNIFTPLSHWPIDNFH